uniref:EF-hand domain-containing protein n=1 Tax=Salix viminalis TaxID=40686 RepID=A0A6N2N069_SALVM
MGYGMGIYQGPIKGTSKVEMTMEEFKKWVLRDLDADQDGKITKDELAEAVRRSGEWFAGLKAWKGMRSADSNRNGVVDDIEITNLAEFAQKHLGIMIILILHVPLYCRFAIMVPDWRWLKTFDADKDGRISREELEDAMPGGWFTRWKGKRGVRSADSDGNGFIEESEINNLVELAQKYLGVKILHL